MSQLDTLTDQQLVAIWPQQHEPVFAEIYNRYWDRLLAVAYHRLENLQDAEECVQDVFCKFWAVRYEFKLKGKDLSFYLAQAIRNQIFTFLRRKYRIKEENKALQTQEQQINFLTPERQFIIAELSKKFDEAIEDLPPQCKLVYLLKKDEGLTVNEIAERLHISINTVKSHLKKANKDLRKNTELLTLVVFVLSLLQKK
ncbi:RNA polymerase sigma-70 factor, ECF subfamily [Sphingobacterium nematocida]|uniref:RNA polymerase sigma-70 factor, ECF subfamily n=1 Tax=Sphingobacterium nematocida TaxID=1513896 RepID=A0A1T5ATI4_9SPHI|nr:RNA polymerase sigma-70 factor [Sphingobacterium nematocida]SKB38324.1 RNA polymerase sigma-70 factor, ECF subfamily [Sphingobacterium nematocida]